MTVHGAASVNAAAGGTLYVRPGDIEIGRAHV